MTISLNKATESLVGPLGSHCCPVSSSYRLFLCVLCDEFSAWHTEDNQYILLGLKYEPALTVGVRNGAGCVGFSKLLSLSELVFLSVKRGN